MIEEKEVKTWWAYLYNNEEYDDDSIVVGELLDHHPKQGPLHWQAGLFEVVQKSEFDSQSQLLKEKEETIQSLQKSLFGRSAHADVMEHKATKANALLCEKDARIEELEGIIGGLQECCDDFNEQGKYLVKCLECSSEVSANMCESEIVSNHIERGGDIIEFDATEYLCLKCIAKDKDAEIARLRNALRISGEKHEGMAMCFEAHGSNLNLPFLIDDCRKDAQRAREALAKGDGSGS